MNHRPFMPSGIYRGRNAKRNAVKAQRELPYPTVIVGTRGNWSLLRTS
jgi:hypothetical protein